MSNSNAWQKENLELHGYTGQVNFIILIFVYVVKGDLMKDQKLARNSNDQQYG